MQEKVNTVTAHRDENIKKMLERLKEHVSKNNLKIIFNHCFNWFANHLCLHMQMYFQKLIWHILPCMLLGRTSAKSSQREYGKISAIRNNN